MNELKTRSRWRKSGTLLLGFLVAGSGQGFTADVFVNCRKIGSKTYAIDGWFQVQASSRAAWDVLTDYDHMQQFVPDMRSSKVKQRRPDGVLLEQEATGRFFLFSRAFRVLLDVREQPLSRIIFKDVLLKDFQTYEGSWTIEDNSPSLKITYGLKVVPVSDMPTVITAVVLKRNARNLFNKVRMEIIIRNIPR